MFVESQSFDVCNRTKGSHCESSRNWGKFYLVMSIGGTEGCEHSRGTW